MDIVYPIGKPVGRLADPLIDVVERIQRTLGERCMTVFADRRGNLFVAKAEPRSREPTDGRSAIGTYDLATPLIAIEDDLRLALRARARKWITDWDLPCGSTRRGSH